MPRLGRSLPHRVCALQLSRPDQHNCAVRSYRPKARDLLRIHERGAVHPPGTLRDSGFGDLDVPGCRNDLGSTCHPVVLGQDVVDVVAELESNGLGGPTSLGEVSLWESSRLGWFRRTGSAIITFPARPFVLLWL